MRLLPILLIVLTPLAAQEEVRYSYDKIGRITRVEYPGGRAIAYTYDSAGRLVRREFVAAAAAPASRPAAKAPAKEGKGAGRK